VRGAGYASAARRTNRGALDPHQLRVILIEIVKAVYGHTLATTLLSAPSATRDASRDLDVQLEQLEHELARAELLGAAAPASIGHVRGMLRVLEADERALRAYTVRDRPPIPLAVLHTSTRWDGSRGPIAAPNDETLGWSRVTSGIVAVNPVPGDHSTMLRTPNVDQLAHALALCLKNAQ